MKIWKNTSTLDGFDDGLNFTESKTEAVRNRFFVPAIESTELSPLLEFLVEGGSLELGKFMYNDFESWLKVKYSEAYQPGARALQKAGEGIIDNIIEEMGRKNIEDFYSMGPTADLDKLTLERFAQMCKKVRYHPIDISGSAIYDTKKELTDYLDKSVPGWGKYVTIVDTKPMKFDELETDKPSCLSFPGGQIMNINGLLDMAGRLCKEDGLVVADLHQRGSDNDGAFWLPQ